MTKKRGRTHHKTTHNNRRSESDLCASTVGKKKSASAARPTFLRSSKAYDAGRSLVGLQHNLLPGLGLGRRRVFPPLSHRKQNVQPLLVVPGLVFKPQPNARWDDVEGAMAHHQPLALRVWEHNEAAAIKPLPPWSSPPGPHCGVAPDVGHGMLAWLKAASSGERRRRQCEAPAGSSRSAALLKSHVRMTALSFEQRSRMRNKSAMQTDLRLAHHLLMWMLATVK